MHQFLCLARALPARILIAAAGLLCAAMSPAGGQDSSGLTDASVAPDGRIRVLSAPLSTPDAFALESSDSPAGPWSKVPDAERNPNGVSFEYLIPRKSYFPRRFYRLGPFGAGIVPFIRFVSPNANVRPGSAVTLLGQNFAPAAAGNTVKFELPGQTWTAAVTEAAANHLIVTVPPDLTAPATGSGTVYRVSVSTAAGVSNIVACTVFPTTANTFMLRPASAYITQNPGTGRETLVAGGGTPPYKLKTLTASDLTKLSAQLDGPVLEVTGVPGVNFGNVDLIVEDSSTPPKTATSTVYVQRVFFAPTFTASFDSLLAGSSPGLTMSAALEIPFLNIEKTEFLLQNLAVETSRLLPGLMIGFARAYRGSTNYGFTHLQVREVSPGRAKFDVLSFENGNLKVVSTGELIESPPSVVIDVPGLRPGSLLPTSLTQEFVFADDIFRLPPASGQNFSITANFTSVSTREDKYLPRTGSAVRSFTTTGLTAGNPRIDRMLPPQGEAGLNVALRCHDVSGAAGGNVVTFAGAGGTRVPAPVVFQSVENGAGEIVVTVPKAAVRGPVRVTTQGKDSNDFRFSPLFRPVVHLTFDSFTANSPVAPQFSHEQPKDEAETAGEVPLQSLTFTLDGGQINVPVLTLDQQVGTAKQTNRYTGQVSNYTILYDGQEPAPSSRQKFRVTLGFVLTLARLYYSQNSGGNGVTLTVEADFGGFYAGALWEYQFTTPIYRPPSAAGTAVTGQIELISQPWQAFPGTEMHFTKLFNRTTQ